MNISPVRLILVEGRDGVNANKFYNMTPNGSEFIAEWGRVGVTSATKRYPISKWHSTYNEKTKKGYKDVTDLVKVTSVKSGFAGITNPPIESLMVKLQGFSKQSVTDNYTISSAAVTPAQVREAQAIVDALTPMVTLGADNQTINTRLLQLYSVIPRKMKKVQLHLVSAPIKDATILQAARALLDNEQQTLDVMAGQVSLQGADTDVGTATILDALGITIDVATAQDIARIKQLMSPSHAHQLRNAYVVTHKASRDKYSAHVASAANQKAELFWHGSRNENWISILKTGLLIRPSNAIINGAMFGHGIYFANKFKKSLGYSSLSGSHWTRGNQSVAFLSLLDVHVGKQYEIRKHNSECYSLNESVLKQKGNYDSVFAPGGYDLINDEFIVYNNAQSTIQYLIEVGN